MLIVLGGDVLSNVHDALMKVTQIGLEQMLGLVTT
jgi:hypothetical protein